MKYAEALTALIDQQYAHEQRHAMGGDLDRTRDEVAVMRENIIISAKVMGALNDDFLFRAEDVEYGIFDNTREYGVTLSVADWTFCVYEHRNSDRIHIEGCPTADVLPYGPYGGEDKYDTLAWFEYEQYYEARKALEEMVVTVRVGADVARADLKAVAG